MGFSRLRRRKEQEGKDVTSCSSNMEINLAHDVIINILSCLPVSSIMRFKCVCKSWRSLLEDPYFAEIHTGRQCAHPNSDPHTSAISFLLVWSGYCSSPNLKLSIYDLIYSYVRRSFDTNLITPVTHPPMFNDFNDGLSGARVIGTCNGLVCLLIRINGYMRRIVVYNPVTREYVNLPHYNTTEYFPEIDHGFGYHRPTREYKILGFGHSVRIGSPADVTVHVYTLGSGTWRIREALIQRNTWSYCSIHFDGSLYWLCHCTPEDEYVINYFDLGDEEFGLMRAPKRSAPRTSKYCYELTILEMNLCVIEGALNHEMNIWVMKRQGEKNDGDSWSKDFIIPYNYPLVNIYDYHPKLHIRDSTIVFVQVWPYDGTRSIFSYDTKRAKTNLTSLPLVGTNGAEREYMSWRVLPYMRSIISLKALGEKDVKMVVPAAGSAAEESNLFVLASMCLL